MKWSKIESLKRIAVAYPSMTSDRWIDIRDESA
jgi:hypothetical protein